MKCHNCEKEIQNTPVALTVDYEYYGETTYVFCCEGCRDNYTKWTWQDATLGEGCTCSIVLTQSSSTLGKENSSSVKRVKSEDEQIRNR